MTVIWDWNGTLADDVQASLQSVNDMLARREMEPITLEQYWSYLDSPISRFYEHLFDLSILPMEVISQEFQAGYRKYFAGLHPGAAELVESLSSCGIRQVILTASHRESVEKDLRHFGLSGYFERVIGAEDHMALGKEELALEYMRTAGIRPEEAVLIGDTLHDAGVARMLGCRCLLAAIGHQSPADLRTAGYPVADSFSAVKDYVFAEVIEKQRVVL